MYLLLGEKARSRSLPHLVSFATGALLGAALLGLLPEALESAGPDGVKGVTLSVLAGIALFFVLEKLVIWRHCHADDCETHVPDQHAHGHSPYSDHGQRSAGTLILVGDTVHNILDGVMIAAAFLTDVRLGIVTGVAVMAHEIPSEVGNFAVLLHSGMSRGRALLSNLAISLASIIGGVIGYFFLSRALGVLPYALGVSAACLLYVAVADLIPGLHRRIETGHSLAQVVLIGAGIAVIAFAEHYAHP
ncbi:MAG: ZIP family metal transporter [Steroidobacteraceae bacterium]